MDNEIGTGFLLVGLIFPRITLFFWWITHNLPFNTTPLWGDVILSIFLPRVLFCWWIYDIQGMSGWFLIHLIGLFISLTYHTFNFKSNSKKFEQLMSKSS